ncbi:hypothetical protein QFZ32_008837 [Streptomyces canus]|nr:hypothetical protein [Streptomyces canus]
MTPVSCGRLSSVPWLTKHHITCRADVLLPQPGHTGDHHDPAEVRLYAPWVSPWQRGRARSRRSSADQRDPCRPREVAVQSRRSGPRGCVLTLAYKAVRVDRPCHGRQPRTRPCPRGRTGGAHAAGRTDSREPNEFRTDHDVPAAATTGTADPSALEVRSELLFQSWLWCGTAAYRRSFCRAGGSTAFKREGLWPHRLQAGAQHGCRGPRAPHRPIAAQHLVRRDGRGLHPGLPDRQDRTGCGRDRGESTCRAGRGSPRAGTTPRRTHLSDNALGAPAVRGQGTGHVTFGVRPRWARRPRRGPTSPNAGPRRGYSSPCPTGSPPERGPEDVTCDRPALRCGREPTKPYPAEVSRSGVHGRVVDLSVSSGCASAAGVVSASGAV